jgi:hypothetical protein
MPRLPNVMAHDYENVHRIVFWPSLSGHIMPDHIGSRGVVPSILVPRDHLHINRVVQSLRMGRTLVSCRSGLSMAMPRCPAASRRHHATLAPPTYHATLTQQAAAMNAPP